MLLSIYILALAVIIYWLWVMFAKKKTVSVKNASLNSEQLRLLNEHVLYYQKLNPVDKKRFAKRTAIFLANIKIENVGCTVTELDRVLIGASAVIPMFGFENWMYPNIEKIYLLPDAFNEKFEYTGHQNDRRILGMVGNHFLEDKMVLSQKALRHGFANTTDKHNTAIHEFIHLIDMADGDTDGIPLSITEQAYTLPWLNLIHKKIEAIDDGKSDINPYGATSKREFFAVAGEYFFERPKLLKRKHPELYKKMVKFFNQDLA